MKILLVEDNPADAELIKNLCKIKFPSSDITITSTLADAIKQPNSYNLVILDLGLPDSDGIDTLYELKQHSDTPIVILTGLEDENLSLRAVKDGAQDYLVKGTDTNSLCRSLKFAIERHSRATTIKNVKKTKEQFSQAITHLTNIVDSLNNSTH